MAPQPRRAIPANHFDAEYYGRYYTESETAVVSDRMQENEVAFVLAFCRHIGVQIRRFTDVGAGTGWWSREFARQHPECRHIENFDSSRIACEMYGHRNVAVQDLSGYRSDLVVCRDVLRYVPDAAAVRAIGRLSKKCRGVLYLHVITSDDDIDEAASDMLGFFRPVQWYRDRLLRAGFTDCGMGLFVSGRLTHFDPFAIEAE